MNNLLDADLTWRSKKCNCNKDFIITMRAFTEIYVRINDTRLDEASDTFLVAFFRFIRPDRIMIVDYVIRIIDQGLKTHYPRDRFGRDITDIIINDTRRDQF